MVSRTKRLGHFITDAEPPFAKRGRYVIFSSERINGVPQYRRGMFRFVEVR